MLSANFFGTNSPIKVLNKVARIIPIAKLNPLKVGFSREVRAGSAKKPVNMVVRVIPSWAPERWVLVLARARIELLSPRSPRSRRASRSLRSRLTIENSLATNKPVPMVKIRPKPSINHSLIGLHRQRVYGQNLLYPSCSQHTGRFLGIHWAKPPIRPNSGHGRR